MMGLDLTFASNATLVAECACDCECHGDGLDATYLQANSDFPDHADDLRPGWYLAENIGGDRVGPYSYYYRFRQFLARVVANCSAEMFWNGGCADAPLARLINFSDCEGLIGPKTAAGLLDEMDKVQDEFDACLASQGEDARWYGKTWNLFKRAFTMARRDGFVKFC